MRKEPNYLSCKSWSTGIGIVWPGLLRSFYRIPVPYSSCSWTTRDIAMFWRIPASVKPGILLSVCRVCFFQPELPKGKCKVISSCPNSDRIKPVGTSLVAQWLRICLPVRGIRVRSVVGEDPTCRGATMSMHHNYWACALEPTSHNYWSPRT